MNDDLTKAILAALAGSAEGLTFSEIAKRVIVASAPWDHGTLSGHLLDMRDARLLVVSAQGRHRLAPTAEERREADHYEATRISLWLRERSLDAAAAGDLPRAQRLAFVVGRIEELFPLPGTEPLPEAAGEEPYCASRNAAGIRCSLPVGHVPDEHYGGGRWWTRDGQVGTVKPLGPDDAGEHPVRRGGR